MLLGDILHNFERTTQKPFQKACDFIVSVSKYVEIYVIIGNHDRPHKDGNPWKPPLDASLEFS